MKDIYNKIISEKHIGKETNPINQKDILSLAGHYSRNYENKSNGIGLVIVNVQRDFVDPKKGALPVKGAVKDVKRIIRFIYENLEDIYSIYTAMDTHYYDSIFHPYMWKKANGEEIEPFTEVTLDKINSNEIIPLYKKEQIAYVKKLKNENMKNLIIWPYHCLYGTDGWLIEKQLNNMLLFFERAKETNVNKIMKGTERFTEMYGAIKPEIVTPETRFFDMAWVYDLKNYKKICICGEAKDLGLYETVKQICIMYSGDKNITKKINVMMNCGSSIYDNKNINKKYETLSDKYGIKLIEV
ncbi:nicotinamidase [Brachyspira sp. G79]|uniref:nicotinamidase n=1 Tax=Brachyspira sp. G79 TaxID=1358104 RepID=UPI000BBBE4D5|nr:nicotinamidase [Brachyspira sp. G79]PCG20641.1 nicotinamidase [Brachyspira sp. G79]